MRGGEVIRVRSKSGENDDAARSLEHAMNHPPEVFADVLLRLDYEAERRTDLLLYGRQHPPLSHLRPGDDEC